MLTVPNQNKIETTCLTTGFSTNLNQTVFPVASGSGYARLVKFCVIPFHRSSQRSVVAATQTLPVQNTGYSIPLYFNNMTIFNGKRCVVPDVASGLTIDFNALTANGVITISGYDQYGVAMQETVTVTSGTIRYVTNKMWFYVESIVINNSAANNITIGFNAQIGLPYFLPNKSYIVRAVWDNAVIASNLIIEGNKWRITAGASATSADARGSINLTVTPPNGARKLFVVYYVYGEDSLLNAQLYNENVVIQSGRTSSTNSALSQVLVDSNTSGDFVLPYLVFYDTYGVQYPGNLAFINEYNAALAA